MLKKAKAELGSDKNEPKGLAQAILDSSHEIWLAGLGAFAKAQSGGMKVFETLVKQGEGLEEKTRAAAAQTADAARGAAKAKAREMQTMAGDTWDKLEQVFENRVARALGRLGVYSAADVKKLTDRVDALSEAVNELLKAQRGRGTPKPRTPKSRPARTAQKRAKRKRASEAASTTPSKGA